MSIRITAGEKRGFRLTIPADLDSIMRPTKDRVREAMFSAISSRLEIEGVRVLDLFSGTGMLTFEAISRGASHSLMVDSSAKVLKFSMESAVKLGMKDLITQVKADSLKFLAQRSAREQFDLVCMDPPYKSYEFAELIKLVLQSNILSEKGILVYEEDSKFFSSQYEQARDIISPYFSSISIKTYGATAVALLKI